MEVQAITPNLATYCSSSQCRIVSDLAWQEGKSMVDTDRSSWQKLSAEFEEEGYTDLNVNGHEFYKKGGVDKGGALNK